MNNNVPPKTVYLAESHTSITTSTNGNEVHVESNDSGSISVETINGETTIKTSPGMKVNVTKGEAKVKDNLSPKKKHKVRLNIWLQIKNIFDKLFRD